MISKKERFRLCINYFMEQMPAAETELRYKDPYQLLVAVILSAQCTDKRVNMITPAFFDTFPAADSLAVAEIAFKWRLDAADADVAGADPANLKLGSLWALPAGLEGL